MLGLWVLVGTLIVGGFTGALLKLRNGRIRDAMPAVGTSADRPPLPEPVTAALTPGTVTLVQLSTTFCAPCRHARAVFARLAETTDGLTHAELDVTDRPEVAQRLRVLSTPTTIAFDREGHELLRISGVPRLEGLREALAPYLRLTE